MLLRKSALRLSHRAYYTMAYTINGSLRLFTLMDDVLQNSITSGPLLTDIPGGMLKIPLHLHQQVIVKRMEELEHHLTSGMDCSGETLYSSYGILGDSVGTGKSLMVLAHIARLEALPPLTHFTAMGAYSSVNVLSIKHTPFTKTTEACSLIIVPHTLFRQWSDYIKKQTNLRHLLVDKKKVLQGDTFVADVMAAQVVLVSNTLYKEFSAIQVNNSITWKRVFIDEADTIHLVNGYRKPETRFTWFITASWINMLYPNETIYMARPTLGAEVFSPTGRFRNLAPFFKEVYHSTRPYTYARYNMTSFNFFREIINAHHLLRSKLVLRCHEDFVKESISLPVLYRSNILCRAPITQRIVSEIVPEDVKQLLHGGDVAGAIAALGVKAEDTTSLIDAVTKNLQKELVRLKATYDYKASLEYSSNTVKEAALQSLADKMKHVQESINTIEQRIKGFEEDTCPICYDDELADPIITPCCSRLFCGTCIIQCLSRTPACPMCRSTIEIKKLKKVVSKKDVTAIVASDEPLSPADQLEKKPDALIRLFKENPEGRFLVFSRYDNPFLSMEESIAALGIKVKQLKGNKDAVAATLRAFDGGDLRCLLLNSYHAGSGLNITAATHVVLLHAMTHEEEKQILGRAHRIGRKEPLHFIRLLHEDELQSVN